MHKIYKIPSVKIVSLDDVYIIASSDSSKSIGVTDTNTDFSDKAPTRTLWGDE